MTPLQKARTIEAQLIELRDQINGPEKALVARLIREEMPTLRSWIRTSGY